MLAKRHRKRQGSPDDPCCLQFLLGVPRGFQRSTRSRSRQPALQSQNRQDCPESVLPAAERKARCTRAAAECTQSIQPVRTTPPSASRICGGPLGRSTRTRSLETRDEAVPETPPSRRALRGISNTACPKFEDRGLMVENRGWKIEDRGSKIEDHDPLLSSSNSST